MPIVAQCGCGKRVAVADALAGRTIRCPACGDPISVGEAAPAPVGRAARKKAASPVVYISLGKIIAVICLGVAVVCGILVAIGPIRVWNQWETIGPTADENVKDVISYALAAEMSQQGMYDPAVDTHMPSVGDDVLFYRPIWVLGMPDRVKFEGHSSEGPFDGWYHPATGEIEANISYGGASVLGGMIQVAKAPLKFSITGRKKDGQVTAETNGQALTIYYPPHPEKEHHP